MTANTPPQRPQVAYFSMEIALRSEIPTYSGGLGILAGDTLRSAADLGLPMVGVSLLSQSGYFRQTLSPDGRQLEQPEPWQPGQFLSRLPAQVSVLIEGRELRIGAWQYSIERAGGCVPVILLDTDLPANDSSAHAITHNLYGGDAEYRLRQEIVLGIGGARMLQALGYRIRKYHLNEGHAALLPLELLRRQMSAIPEQDTPAFARCVNDIRALCSFTTHTPVAAGHDVFAHELVVRVLGSLIEMEQLRQLGGMQALNMTELALNLCGYVNGVSQRHSQTAQQMYPQHRIHSITNGIHPATWAAPALSQLFDRKLPGWRIEPETLIRADRVLSDDEVWRAHEDARWNLIELLERVCGVRLDPHRPILGFARRMTGYKRPELLFNDLDRLRSIAQRYPFQIVLAGKAHPKDQGGRDSIRQLHEALRYLAPDITGAFLPNYDMGMAQIMIPGVDIWLNTPLPPLEASGTSGMKAALNGVPSLSTLDGWWLEGWIEGVTGWAIGTEIADTPDDHAASLYDKLENVVLPLYHNRASWLAVMKGAISRNGALFSSHRMMRRYAAEAYL